MRFSNPRLVLGHTPVIMHFPSTGIVYSCVARLPGYEKGLETEPLTNYRICPLKRTLHTDALLRINGHEALGGVWRALRCLIPASSKGNGCSN